MYGYLNPQIGGAWRLHRYLNLGSVLLAPTECCCQHHCYIRGGGEAAEVPPCAALPQHQTCNTRTPPPENSCKLDLFAVGTSAKPSSQLCCAGGGSTEPAPAECCCCHHCRPEEKKEGVTTNEPLPNWLVHTLRCSIDQELVLEIGEGRVAKKLRFQKQHQKGGQDVPHHQGFSGKDGVEG